MSERLNGKTAWEFACGWYTPDQIAYSIKNRHRPPSETVIPDDIDSVGFAQWLTEQYRLAMAKGIQIAQQDSHERLDAAEAEVQRLRLFFEDLSKKHADCQEKALFTEADLDQARAVLSLGVFGAINAESIALAIACGRLDTEKRLTARLAAADAALARIALSETGNKCWSDFAQDFLGWKSTSELWDIIKSAKGGLP